MLPPYGQIPQDVLVAGHPIRGSPITNSRAELIAATKAVERCLQILEKYPGAQVMLLTDAAYVLQVLEGGTVGFAHVPLQAGLCMLWHRCANRVTVKHVHAHKGHALNEITDRTAKEGLEHPTSHYFIRRLDYSCAYVPPTTSAGPHQ